MTAAAQKVIVKADEFDIETYQLIIDGRNLLLLTHRQIGEIVGKSKEAAQRFIKQHANNFPPPVKAFIPDKPRPVPLTSWEAAVAYWQKQAELGNATAIALIAAVGAKLLSEIEIISDDELNSTNSEPTQEITATKSELQLIAEGIELASRWMEEAGVDQRAIAHWRLNQLREKVPALAEVSASAQSFIAQNTTSPTGLIPSQLAEKLSEQLERRITAAQVNQALHALGLQDWAKPGKNRERKLTDAGKQYGTALLSTSKDGWQGAQLRWFESVIPLLCQHLSASKALTEKHLA
ncbi:MAG: hypothetical protein F6K58_12980 [Symploca sp. SIO2E9]|nr:hypothetical protein [Symploca sp. SIO2E9]